MRWGAEASGGGACLTSLQTSSEAWGRVLSLPILLTFSQLRKYEGEDGGEAGKAEDRPFPFPSWVMHNVIHLRRKR